MVKQKKWGENIDFASEYTVLSSLFFANKTWNAPKNIILHYFCSFSSNIFDKFVRLAWPSDCFQICMPHNKILPYAHESSLRPLIHRTLLLALAANLVSKGLKHRDIIASCPVSIVWRHFPESTFQYLIKPFAYPEITCYLALLNMNDSTHVLLKGRGYREPSPLAIET